MKKSFSIFLSAILSSAIFFTAKASESTTATTSQTRGETPSRIQAITAGYDLYTLRPKAAASYSLNGFAIGYTIDFKLSSQLPLYLGTGISGRATFRGKRFHDSATYNEINAKVSTRFINFNIPVNLSYRLPISHLLSFTPQFGFNFTVQAYGHAKTTLTLPDEIPQPLVKANGFTPGDVDLFSKSALGNRALRRFQAGWHAALKLQYDQFVLGISYGTDFAKIKNELGSSNLLVNLGYVF